MSPGNDESRPAGGGQSSSNAQNHDQRTTASEVTIKERDTLMKIAKQQARVARPSIAQRQARILAAVEEQLSAQYDLMDAAWRNLYAESERAIREADAAFAERCAERGIPEEFRPRILSGWMSRGTNAIPARRAELRRQALTKAEAAAKAAKLEIDRSEGAILVQLLSGHLTTEAALKYLTDMPKPDELMSALELGELEAAARMARRRGLTS